MEFIVEENPYPTYKVDGFSVRCDDWLIQRGVIVRCKDCKHCMSYMAGAYCDYMKHSIKLDAYCDYMKHSIKLDGYCAWGEWKDNK